MLKNFMLSYNVTPNDSKYQDEADAFRDKIEDFLLTNGSDFESIKKHSPVHTTITGLIDVSGINDNAKEKDAINKLAKTLSDASKKDELPTKNIAMNCVMMINGIGEPFTFEFKRKE